MSYITVPAEKVIKHCEAFLVYNDMLFRAIQAELIKKLVNEKKFILFGPKYTYDEAYNILENDISFTSRSLKYHSRPNCDGFDEVSSLLKLAKNGGPVTVSNKHSFIFDYN